MHNIELYPFQKEMVDKFSDPRYPHVLCGDDMGLGKTIEAMTLDRSKRLNSHRSGQKTLILAPLTPVGSWEDHYARFMPEYKVCALDPKNRCLFLADVQRGDHDIYIMHWDALRLMPELSDKFWFHVIGDEIHRIKNRKAQVTRALKKIKTANKLGLSGTPADNAPQDLWSILNWLYPKTFSSYWRFFKMYVDYIADPNHGYHIITGVRNEKHLHRQIEPFFIRRRKEEILTELPDKYYTSRWVELTPQQRKAYDQMRKNMLAWVGDQLDKPLAAPIVITQLMRLQQFADACVDIEPSQVYNRKTEAFEYKYRYILTEPSSKLNECMDIIESTDESIVVFSQFKQMVYLLGAKLEAAGVSFGLLTGDTPKGDRDNLVADFQAGKKRVFVATIGAGREGITLTKSSTVVFLDRAWPTGWNRQAEDRLHRIGQANAVQVIDIMAKNTVDYGRKQRIEMKWTQIQKLLGDITMDYQKEMAE